MQDELNQLVVNDVWELVLLPINQSAIGTKWVFRNKLDENGIVSRNKARFVAQGYNQQEGIDYDETYALVARLESIKILLAIDCTNDFKLYQMDLKSAFLNGFINEEVYVAQPPGFIDFQKPNYVYKLKKALYGLKQALKAWYELKAFLIKHEYSMETVDNTLFTKKSKSHLIIVQIYVDDIIFGSTSQSLCDDFVKIMRDEFEMSMMGELNFLLGLQIKQMEDEIFFNQSKYIKEMLKKFGLEDSKPTKTPMSTEIKLTKYDETDSMDSSKYRGTEIETIVYDDFDHTGDCVDHKSTSGVCTFMGCCLTSWFAKKQTDLAISTTEVGYVSAGKACQQALWMKQALIDYDIRLDDVLIMYDNKGTIELSTKMPSEYQQDYKKTHAYALKIYNDPNMSNALRDIYRTLESSYIHEGRTIDPSFYNDLSDDSVAKFTAIENFKDHDSNVDFPPFANSSGLCALDRDSLETPVSLDEVKNAVWDCGSSKAPGPDGFSFTFVKKYWDDIKVDILEACLSLSRASALVNGSPTLEFSIKRGLRKGDPLSHFLFILVKEGLHNALSTAVSSGLIRGVKFISPEVFYLASGLKINIQKFNVYGIGVLDVDVSSMASNSGCALGFFPFNYLGLPIGGLHTLIKDFLGSLCIYYFSVFKVYESILNSLERSRAMFFESDLNIGSPKAFNLSLLLKWHWRLFSHKNALWIKVIKALHGQEGGFDNNGCIYNVRDNNIPRKVNIFIWRLILDRLPHKLESFFSRVSGMITTWTVPGFWSTMELTLVDFRSTCGDRPGVFEPLAFLLIAREKGRGERENLWFEEFLNAPGICMTTLMAMNVLAGVLVYGDDFKDPKVVSTLLCLWAFCSYVYEIDMVMKGANNGVDGNDNIDDDKETTKEVIDRVE
uniref:Retrovirus-related Pol polyprotein from transposon TNT 1-94 n=1 Tax=Tanacetum cinerariifolium TaxID=118510 RepID=A0A6L2P1Y4_TANCI|nr:retrovirus-related Pol polyprotein from transposon TNT 1-94 [Tanacetum cinerariifolium]